jgi:hypothetical protein
MKISTGIFFLILVSVCYVSNAQKAFDQVRALLKNLQTSNLADQKNANVRQAAEKAWCKKVITAAVKLLARRQHDVDSLVAHIQFLTKTRHEAKVDRKTRQERIKANKVLLEKFKKQRCDNNLLFVKQLREHMEAVDVLGALRNDIIGYFNAKPKGFQGLGFVEKFSEYSHLLDDTHKASFVELKTEITNLRPHAYDAKGEAQWSKLANSKDIDAQGDRITKEKERNAKQIGTGHVDNNKGELKRLATPKYQQRAQFNTKTRKRVLAMIDGLIAHLKASRDRLTRDEIHAAEDFAIFQNSMDKENEYLEEKIAQLTKEILDLTNQINISNVQLVKRKKLRDQAKAKLELLRKICREKKAYFAKETARRQKEDGYIKTALAIFENKLMKLSGRVRRRASRGNNGKNVQGKGFSDELGHRVVSNEGAIRSENTKQTKERNEVVF